MIILAYTLQDGLDAQKCMALGMVHDMAETYAGDIPTYAGVSKGLLNAPPKGRNGRTALQYACQYKAHSEEERNVNKG